ncbi:hypothetical protein [Hymenobacter arizonensis]|uniref:hypothetical protein n=1 Tax=Hymenobacter arizonensis TaxID=1227077 RepID=UPI001160C9D8|nr:hypothetical protein [Hymenobacter arizonensis]
MQTSTSLRQKILLKNIPPLLATIWFPGITVHNSLVAKKADVQRATCTYLAYHPRNMVAISK